jgi:cytochrome c peroxidase
MHDGSLATLQDVIERHASPVPFRPSLSSKLRDTGLDARERADILAFLRALTVDRPPPTFVSP